ncbi:MAG: hypothetical protein B6229_07850 [Spirochaetaceae bacterium 4572_7]|nr:MAG: hypothetical protein B6229_07850 [Spirochaetaceae bacterium 4572_7]
MKKILILLFICSALFTVSAEVMSIGVIATPESASLSIGSNGVEIELDLITLEQSILNISADYSIIGNGFNVGNTPGFFWDISLGAGVSASADIFNVNLILPIELGYDLPILSGLDIYIQAKPIIRIYPSKQNDFEIGLGARLGV